MKKATIIYAILLVTASCRHTESLSSHERQEAIAVNTTNVTGLSMKAERWAETRIVETVVMEADSNGVLRERLKKVTTERTERIGEEKIAENTAKIDSAAFLSESDRIILRNEEKPSERRKTAFWRNAFFVVLGLAAIGVGVVFLWRKTLGRWM